MSSREPGKSRSLFLRQPFIRSALYFAIAHFLVLAVLGGVIFFINHIPPKAVRLDALILSLTGVESVLTAPRKFLLWLWPGENTPRGLGTAAHFFNSLSWGATLAGAKLAWRRLSL